MPNFSSLARLEVPEKFLWVVGGVCKVIFVVNPTVVLCCVGVGVLTINEYIHTGCQCIQYICVFRFAPKTCGWPF